MCVLPIWLESVLIIWEKHAITGISHHIYKTPWQDDTRVNIQKGKNGKAKVYQVRQVLAAIKKIKEEE